MAHALAYASRDLHVFPCVANAKVPATGNGCKDACDDAVRIRRWFARDANLAIACGPSRLVVIDVDTKNGEDGFASLLLLEREIGELPITRCARTPSGGVHLYFRAPTDATIRNSARSIAPGLDVRADGGYVLAPPSMIDGKPYEWTIERAVAELPPAWVERLSRRRESQPGADVGHRAETVDPNGFRSSDNRARGYCMGALDDACEELATTPLGARNDAINRLFFPLGGLIATGGIDEREIWDAACAAMDRWPRHERDQRKDHDTLSRALRDGRAHPRELPPSEAFLSRQTEVPIDVYADDLVRDYSGDFESPDIEQGGERDGEAPSSTPHTPPPDPLAPWKTIEELGPWFDAPPPPREWLLRRDGAGVLPRGIVGMVVAPGGRGKSQALVQLALSIATGRSWLDTFDTEAPGRVVLALAEEEPSEVQRRLYYAARGLELSDKETREAARRIVPLGLAGRIVPLVRLDPSGAVIPSEVHAAILAHLERDEHTLVVLDPLSRWAPDVESDNTAATAAVQALERLTQTPGRPVVLCAHHTAKQARRDGNKADGTGARGVTGLYDAVRWEMQLSGMREDDLAIAHTKNNYGPKSETVELVRDREAGVLRPPTSHELDMRKLDAASREHEHDVALRTAVLDVVRRQPGLGTVAMRTEVRSVVGKARNGEIDVAVRALIESGELADRPDTKGHHYHAAGAT